ncbi:MAG: 23S rRNA (pseudouridine(1915)-N(3))-methyltransferase RlmH [Gemmatimonadetes bacterium]|nr:23S rRNA (pseudouridine(1915)-N(3))-methyltransferase RlmH [Gemmatimonadota bacterium]
MKIAVVVVGKAKGAVGEAVGEYEARARRYFSFDPQEVKGRQGRRAARATQSLCDSR